MRDNSHSILRWSCSVAIFKDPLIVKQLLIAIGVPFGIVLLMIAVLSGFSRDGVYAISVIVGLLFLTGVFVKVVYKGKYEVEYFMDASGVRCKYSDEQMKKNRVVNGLTVVLGLMTGKPTVAGAGVLAGARQDSVLKWARVQSVKYMPKHRRIHLRASWFEVIVVYCLEENYNAVCDYVKSSVKSVES